MLEQRAVSILVKKKVGQDGQRWGLVLNTAARDGLPRCIKTRRRLEVKHMDMCRKTIPGKI